MTPSQELRVAALRNRFVKKREVALLECRFANDVADKAAESSEAAGQAWRALDRLVNASNETLLAIVEAV